MSAFLEGMRHLGWIEGRNIEIERRWGEGMVGIMRTQAELLVSGRPDVLAVSTATALSEVRRAAGGIPIVFWGVSDPVGNNFVQVLARPEGNITGFSLFNYEMGGKWLQILKEVSPHLKRALVLMNAANPNWPGWRRAIEPVASSVGLQLILPEVRDAAQLERAVAGFAREPNGGLLVLPDPFMTANRDSILKLAGRLRLPAIYGQVEWVRQGVLVAYGVDQLDLARRAAAYVSRILKGEKPGELPVQAPTRFEFAVNMKTAATLGLRIPPSILVRADEVIR